MFYINVSSKLDIEVSNFDIRLWRRVQPLTKSSKPRKEGLHMQQGLSGIELEAALRLVHLFPRGMSTDYLQAVNGARAEVLGEAIRKMVESLASCAHGATAQAPVPGKLLELVKLVPVSAVMEFRAFEKFRPGETVDGVEISRHMRDGFKAHLRSKVERNVPAANINLHRVLRQASDRDILASLDPIRREIALAHFWEMLKKLSAARTSWVKAFVIGIDGDIKAVSALWYGDGWSLSVDPDSCGQITQLCSY